MRIALAGLLLTVTACLPAARAPTPAATPAAPSATASSSPTITPAARRTPVPIPPERPSDLVVRHEVSGDTCCPVAWAVLTADGRFVTLDDNVQRQERRLTPAGVQRVRDELVATGLFERDQNYPLAVRPGATPPARGVGGLRFTVWRDTRMVDVRTAMHQGADELFFQPSAARTRLDRLSLQLRKPETWLAAALWADPTARPYEASPFALLLRVEPGPASATPTIDALAAAWPFAVGPLAFGQRMPDTAGPMADTTRCAALTKDDVEAVREAIIRAGGARALHTSPDGSFGASFVAPDGASHLAVVARPLLPDRASCTGEYAL